MTHSLTSFFCNTMPVEVLRRSTPELSEQNRDRYVNVSFSFVLVYIFFVMICFKRSDGLYPKIRKTELCRLGEKKKTNEQPPCRFGLIVTST